MAAMRLRSKLSTHVAGASSSRPSQGLLCCAARERAPSDKVAAMLKMKQRTSSENFGQRWPGTYVPRGASVAMCSPTASSAAGVGHDGPGLLLVRVCRAQLTLQMLTASSH